MTTYNNILPLWWIPITFQYVTILTKHKICTTFCFEFSLSSFSFGQCYLEPCHVYSVKYCLRKVSILDLRESSHSWWIERKWGVDSAAILSLIFYKCVALDAKINPSFWKVGDNKNRHCSKNGSRLQNIIWSFHMFIYSVSFVMMVLSACLKLCVKNHR